MLRALATGHSLGAYFNEAIRVTANVIRSALRGNRNWGLILHGP
jgi:hypothetical protein